MNKNEQLIEEPFGDDKDDEKSWQRAIDKYADGVDTILETEAFLE